MLSADEVIRELALAPHPEGGFFRETFRDGALGGRGRAASTAIYYLLPQGEISSGTGWTRRRSGISTRARRLSFA